MILKPKILVIVPFSFYPPASGGEIVMFNNIKALSAYFEVHVALPKPQRKAHIEAFAILKSEFHCHAIDVELKSILNEHLFKKIVYFFRILLGKYSVMDKLYYHPEMTKLLTDSSFDFIQVEHAWAYHSALKQRRCPLILSGHNFEYEYFKELGKSFLKQGQWLQGIAFVAGSYRIKAQEQEAMQEASVIFVLSEIDKKKITGHYPWVKKKIYVSSIGLDRKAYLPWLNRPQSSKDHLLKLIYVGALDSFQTAEAALYFIKEVLPRLRAILPQVQLTVVGRDPVPELQELAKRERGVVLTGFVKEVHPYVMDADIYIVPLRYGSGIRIKIMEAMTLGKVVVSTSKGVEGLDTKGCGGVLIANTTDDFIQRILALAENFTLRKQLGSENAKFAEDNFDFYKNFHRQNLPLYEGLLSSTQRPKDLQNQNSLNPKAHIL